MKTIVVHGTSNSGKTATICRLILELLSSGASLVWKRSIETSAQLITDIQNELAAVLAGNKRRPREKTVILEYNGKYIGITTQGDSDEILEERYRVLLKNSKKPLDVFVCASHFGSLPMCEKIASGSALQTFLSSFISTSSYVLTQPFSTLYVIDKTESEHLSQFEAEEMAVVQKIRSFI